MDSDERTIQRIGRRLLSRLGPLVDRLVAAQRAEIPAYAGLPIADQRARAELHLRWAIQSVLVERRKPRPEELDAVTRSVETLVGDRAPIESILFGLHLSIRESWAVTLDALQRGGVAARAIVELVRARDEWAHAVTAHVVAVHRRLEVEALRLDERRRNRILDAALKGRPGSPLRLPEQGCLVLRARATSEQAARGLEHHLADIVADHDGRGLYGVIDGDLAAIVPATIPVPPAGDVVGGIAAADSSTQIPQAFLLASRALETAHAFGMRGFHSLDAIAVRAAVFSDSDISESLYRRYIEPLEHCGPFGAVLAQTLRTFFANGLRTDATASDLGIHTNSFRHRLRRYAELTGARIDRTEDLVAIWWAMEREVLRNASRPADASGLHSSPAASARGHRRSA